MGLLRSGESPEQNLSSQSSSRDSHLWSSLEKAKHPGKDPTPRNRAGELFGFTPGSSSARTLPSELAKHSFSLWLWHREGWGAVDRKGPGGGVWVCQNPFADNCCCSRSFGESEPRSSMSWVCSGIAGEAHCSPTPGIEQGEQLGFDQNPSPGVPGGSSSGT